MGIVKTNWDLCKPDEDSKGTAEMLHNAKIQHIYCSNGQQVWDLFHDKICGIPCSTVATMNSIYYHAICSYIDEDAFVQLNSSQ